MEQSVVNKRKHERYETDVRLDFRMPYDFAATVDFKISDEVIEGREKVYEGLSKDISVQGLAFETHKHLEIGDLLWIELHLPKSKEVVFMRGEVCWCRRAEEQPDDKAAFLAGISINTVDGMDVEQTVYFDKTYGVQWSELLERVLGGFSKINRKKK
jgi:Tfp pilus assembly protein PilZ